MTKRIVLDENLPRPLKQFLGTAHVVTTVQELGLAGIANGELLARLEGQFDVFLTADKNLRYQQRLTGRTLSIVELPTNRLPVLTLMASRILLVVESVHSGDYVAVPFEAEQADGNSESRE
jgi:hypothetical protein